MSAKPTGRSFGAFDHWQVTIKVGFTVQA